MNSNMLQEISTSSIAFVPQDSYTLMDVVPVSQEHYVGYTCKPYEYIPDGVLSQCRLPVWESPELSLSLTERGPHSLLKLQRNVTDVWIFL